MAELDQWINPAGGGNRNSMKYLLSSGTQTSFEFNFAGGYINAADIKAYIYHTATGLTTPINPVVLTGPNTIEVIPVVPAGDYLVVYRDTPKSQPLVDFVTGAVMNEENLDKVTRQAIFAAAEMVDRFAEIKVGSDDAIARAAQAIITSGEAKDEAEAATLAANSAVATAGAANTKADAAVLTANNAQSVANGIDGKAQSALDNSVSAVDTANAADAKADAAVLTANGIDSKAQTALDNSAAAVSTANDAESTANGIASTANSALQQAGDAVDTANSAMSYISPIIRTFYFFSPGTQGSCFIKTGPSSLSIMAGTTVIVNNVVHTYTLDTSVTMPTLTPGTDYDVWVNPNGTAQAVATSYASPSTAPTTGAALVGGFHYGLVAPGTTPAGGGFATSGFTGAGGNFIWDQAKVDRIAGINEFSMWSLDWRCGGEQFGMTLDPQTQWWNAIYFCSTDHEVNGISKAGTNIASGTVLPKVPTAYGGNGTTTYTRFSYYEALEVAASHNLELYNYSLACSGFLGVTEGTSLGGASVTVPTTTRQPGFTSRIGVEQATGHQWVIGGPLHSTGGTAWATDPGRGSFYGTSGLPLFGGNRGDAGDSGSRAAGFSSVPWDSNWYLSLRAVGCHKNKKGTGMSFQG